MSRPPHLEPPADWLLTVGSAAELFAARFGGARNVVCWRRTLPGDFAEVASLAEALAPEADRVPLDDDTLAALRRRAGPGGRMAIDAMLADLRRLRGHGHEPGLEWLRRYPRDGDPDLPTDVHSFHVDTANAPIDTVLCTYHGDPSEILPAHDAARRIDDPALRARLRRRFGDGDEQAFAAWQREHAFDLHFAPRTGARPFALGVGDLCRLAVAHPGSTVSACIHRAPPPRGEAPGRLLLIS